MSVLQRVAASPFGRIGATMATYKQPSNGSSCGQIGRRTFLADVGMGFTGLALGAMLYNDGVARAESVWHPPDGKPQFAPKAKSVIWIFLSGGYSHLETFDPKPA